VLTTASDLVFSGDNDGNFFAADARTGKELWKYQTGSSIYAPPTTYMIDGRQYVLVQASGGKSKTGGTEAVYIAFALDR
jgi:glucose dehydrogenase